MVIENSHTVSTGRVFEDNLWIILSRSNLCNQSLLLKRDDEKMNIICMKAYRKPEYRHSG